MTTAEDKRARRAAVHAQLLDGTATGVLDTVRRLGFLQIDPIAAVARAERLVLFSRLGQYDPTELDRLLWEERRLVEWRAYIWPIETLPLLRARMRSRTLLNKNAREFLRANASFRRTLLRELDRRGPVLARELDDPQARRRERHRWWGQKRVGIMLEILAARGEVAVVGRRGGHRVFDLAERWYPETERIPSAEAQRRLDEQRFRALGVRRGRDGSWQFHPDADDSPVPDRAVLLSPFDRLVHDRDRAEALFGFRYRLEMFVPKAKREYGYYVLPLLAGDELVGRAEPVWNAATRTVDLLGAWGDTSRLDEALHELERWLQATR
ncbi:MAG TPA: crosslink repair DNA glycosylase YcaQ family protein [Gaiellaceae bacterium]|nr:crosslink repair DNA glycosylase YcaQ family protein [Gaiellaceae bacterium]